MQTARRDFGASAPFRELFEHIDLDGGIPCGGGLQCDRFRDDNDATLDARACNRCTSATYGNTVVGPWAFGETLLQKVGRGAAQWQLYKRW